MHDESIEVLLYPSPASASANYAYSVVPVLTIRNSSGQQVVPVTQAKSWVVFANPSQYTCYGLHGHTFKVEVRGIDAASQWAPLNGCV